MSIMIAVRKQPDDSDNLYVVDMHTDEYGYIHDEGFIPLDRDGVKFGGGKPDPDYIYIDRMDLIRAIQEYGRRHEAKSD